MCSFITKYYMQVLFIIWERSLQRYCSAGDERVVLYSFPVYICETICLLVMLLIPQSNLLQLCPSTCLKYFFLFPIAIIVLST